MIREEVYGVSKMGFVCEVGWLCGCFVLLFFEWCIIGFTTSTCIFLFFF